MLLRRTLKAVPEGSAVGTAAAGVGVGGTIGAAIVADTTGAAGTADTEGATGVGTGAAVAASPIGGPRGSGAPRTGGGFVTAGGLLIGVASFFGTESAPLASGGALAAACAARLRAPIDSSSDH